MAEFKRKRLYYTVSTGDSSTISFPEIKVLTAVAESPRPYAGNVIFSVSNVIIPPDISTESILASAESPRPYAGFSYAYSGPGIATPSPTFLIPPSIIQQVERLRPEPGYVLTLVNQINLPVTLIYPTVAVAESQRSGAGNVIALTTIVAQAQLPTAPVVSASAESPRPEPGKIFNNAAYVIASNIAQFLPSPVVLPKQEFNLPEMGGTYFTPVSSLPSGGGGGDADAPFFTSPFKRNPKYKRLRRDVVAAREKEQLRVKRRAEEEVLVLLMCNAGLL